jgi:aminoglycoside phosphotransferase family enzyme/predicted kinase
VGLPSLIEALLEPRAYPERPEKVTLQQTHISYLFFTPRYVYKVKKPVDFAFLDFSTLKKRLHFCQEEVRLNRRLAPGLYLDVVAITAGKAGKEGVFMEGEGEALEYAVKMKRLPAETMLEAMLERETVTGEVIERVARAVASFHKKAETNERISSFGLPEMIKNNTDENFSQTKDFIGRTITRKQYDDIKAYTDSFLSSKKGEFNKRVQKGFIKDCHGDIHSEHISISDGIQVYDCIEFNERFRYSDIVADSAFLSMDLDFHNRHDLTRLFDDAYFSSIGDGAGRRLLDFYKCYRAFVRGKVEGFKLVEPEETETDKREAELKARLYFHLAHLYATGGFRPTMLVLRGLSGTGKTIIADELSRKTDFVVLSSDAIRKGLFGIKPEEHRFEPFEKGIYTTEATERTYAELIEKGTALVETGRSVILDATFSELKYLKIAASKAKASGAIFHVVECVAEEETIRKRLKQRSLEKGAISDARWEVYKKQKGLFESLPTPFEGGPHLVLKTDGPTEGVIQKVIEQVIAGNVTF